MAMEATAAKISAILRIILNLPFTVVGGLVCLPVALFRIVVI